MKTVLLLGGPAAGQRVEVHGAMNSVSIHCRVYKVVPMCSHGEVHWFGVLDGADPLALLIAGYGTVENKLADLTDTQRETLFAGYCTHCGTDDPRCQCWNDA